MNKWFLFLAIILSFYTVNAQTPKKIKAAPILHMPNIPAKSWILMDYATGIILAEHNSHDQLEPASITKVMTGYIIAEALSKGEISNDDMVKISIKAWKQRGSRMFIKESSMVSVQNLITGLIVQSGNDAAVALAEHLSGSEESFVVRMNETAAKLGMKNTHFVNTSGLPNKEHLSTAYDLALLSRALIHNFPEHYKIYAQKSFTWNKITQNNRNKLLWTNKNVDGIKTGHTDSAGYNIAISALENDVRLIVVILGASSETERQKAAMDLTNFGYQHFKVRHLYSKYEAIHTVRVKDGLDNKIMVGVDQDIDVILPSTKYANVRAELDIKNFLIAPVKQNTVVGELKILFNELALYRYPIVTLNSVSALDTTDKLWETFKRKLNNRYNKFKSAL